MEASTAPRLPTENFTGSAPFDLARYRRYRCFMLARSPDRKRATEYLHASGAVPITIKSDGTDSFADLFPLPVSAT